MGRGLRMLVLLIPGLFVPTALIGAEPPRTPPPAIPRIPALIAQLGSSRFNEREAATKELGQIGLPARAVLKEAAKSKDAEVRRRARRLLARIDNSLEALAEDYQRYGLPLTANAPLVWVETPYFRGPGKVKVPFLAFQLERGTEKKPPRLLQGMPLRFNTVRITITSCRGPARATRKQQQEIARRCALWTPENGVLFALQCRARGWSIFARSLFGQALQQEAEWAEELHRASRSAPQLVRLGAWEYWKDELIEGDTPWAAIRPRLKTILRDAPELDKDENRALLESLAAALVPSGAKPGSIEAMIDDLIHIRSISLGEYWDDCDDRYARVVDQGFDAVPALIEHLDDRRLTHYLWVSGGGLPGRPHHYRVGDAASAIVTELSGIPQPQEWRPPPRAAVRAWWEKARKMGEEPYLVAHALPAQGYSPNDLILHILKSKYPRSLARLYRTVLEERPEMNTFKLTELIADSVLPRRQKVEQFLHAMKNKRFVHRASALQQLKKLEPEQFRRLLVETLDQLPVDKPEAEGRCSPYVFTPLVLATEDRSLWRALERAARRADLGERLMFLDGVGEPGEAVNRQQLAFLAAFLDDSSLRDVSDNPEKYQGIPAGYEFPRLEIRNYAALKLAVLLKVKADPRSTWTPAQWAELRQQVRQALRERKGER